MAEGRILESWKEIAEYLRRTPKTCQRWERELDLPIHRLDGSPKASVFAYQDELDRWLNEKLHEREWAPKTPAPGSSDERGRPTAAPARAMRSIAVLPFENLTRDPAHDYFVEGIHEGLITELAKLGTVKVTSRSSVMQYQGQQQDLRKVARELGVEALVEGAILRSGDRVRVTAQLIRGDTDQHVWAEKYDRDVDDVLALLDEVSRAIANEVGRMLGETASSVQPRVRKPHRVLPKAYEAYLRGRQILNQGGIVATLFPRVEHNFEEATRLDPDFAEAWGALAMNRAGQAFLGLRPPGEMLPLAREAARRALDLDERTGRAWAALGFISLYFDWNFAAAKEELERAVSLTPHDAWVRHAYSDYFVVMGQTAESLAQVRLGLEHNPDSLAAVACIPGHAVAAKRYQEAIDTARAVLARNPEVRNNRHFLAKALWLMGSYREAIVEFGKLWGPANEQARVLQAAFKSDGPRAAMKAVAEYLAAGTGTQAPNPTEVASYFAIAHESDAAFAWLEKAFAQRLPGLLHVPADPFFDPIRNDPRIDDLCRRVGLPVEAWRGSASRITPPVVPA
jgi:TolB-like protein/Tfp pilus assembly protein PilF